MGLWSRDEHLYQLGLRQFGALKRLRMEPAPSLRELLRVAAEDEPGIAAHGLSAQTVVEVGPNAALWILGSDVQ